MTISAVPPMTSEEEAVVRALGRIVLVLPRVLEADLLREQRMAAHEYSVLMILSESPAGSLRMSELSAGCQLSLSGISRIVDRLEADGLVERTKCSEDRRGANAVLTDLGRARLLEAWPSHLASVRRHILDHLGELDLGVLATALARIGTVADPPICP